MFADASRPLIFHGEQVGVTTLSMVRLQEHMLAARPVITADAAGEAEFKARYGETLGASCWAEFSQKRMTAAKAEALNDLLSSRWPEICDRIRDVLLTSDRLTSVLRQAGADLTPEAIHLSRSFYETALLRCREIRNRYTFLDLAAGAGRLEPWLGEL
jgi:glycerol-1-phosphate dehydrogenase [NAD(P)+]